MTLSRWRRKFAVAGRGVALAVRGESSVRVHLLAAVAVGVAAAVLGCTRLEWAVLVLCVGLVVTAELLNTAVEVLFRGLPPAERDRVFPCLDVAAGAVLVASAASVVVGLLVFVPRLIAAV